MCFGRGGEGELLTYDIRRSIEVSTGSVLTERRKVARLGVWAEPGLDMAIIDVLPEWCRLLSLSRCQTLLNQSEDVRV